ncbi:MAG: type II secretion system ATPase GspE [Proteobacteria bacterium]|nr:type II secretion system ATPase GspE [Pseudomonadota bacterium]MBU1234820.1 type II secretion system ATPase GspE [Pseudomonadota bacterium]MBU1419797.1 type II secretion system ATPase GspE [Pseudomonadota bacterium]MBU1456765.1 type II secretion system ATPase GspE [Pseudomonadota bacterium]
MQHATSFFTERLGIPGESVHQALELQKEKGGTLVRILVRQNMVDEIELLKKLGKEMGMDQTISLPPEIQTDFTASIPIAFLKKHIMVPVAVGDDAFIAINDPFNFQALDDLRRLLGWVGVRPVLCPQAAIVSAINFAYDMTQNTAEEVMQDIDEEDPEALFSEIEETGDLLDDTSDSPVIRLVNLMFSQAVRDNASDIHIEPYQNSLKVRQRLDGILYDMLNPPKHVQSALISRIKIMANLNIAEKRLPQDGRIELKVANKDVDIRVSTLPTAFGERVVLRLLDKSSVLISLTDLGMPEDRFIPFSEQIRAANGIVLVTGPTGSGKTTTLYAALTSINNTDINIITVEDPIEYRISGIGQVQINPKINLTFASGLRSIVRQDPDVILVGEIRDTETAKIAIQSALTGHLVFSTLHTNDASSAITRLIDMGIEPFLLSSSINAILAQRLVRIICPHCKEGYIPDPVAIKKLGLTPEEVEGKLVYRGQGCPKCHYTGFKGRCGIFELLLMDQAMKHLVLSTANANAIKDQAVKNGMITLRRDGADKVLKGITTIEEVYRVSQE